MTPRCLECDKPMKEHGRAFRCEPCRQFIVFFEAPETSPFLALIVTPDRSQPVSGAYHASGLRAPR
jgi:hypothetical protein